MTARYRERVTRIIAGRARGTSLTVPDAGTRPTSDRVRESLFGALESAGLLTNARVADLYAGSGALGLEAVSRGSVSADLVESAPRAVAVIRANAERVQRHVSADIAQIRVHRASVLGFLRAGRGPYDLVFLDPPYNLDDDELTRSLAALVPLLAQDAVVIVERDRRSGEPDWATSGLAALRDRTYGDTGMWWGQPRAESQSR